jgi:general secretion pathway protein C
MKLRLLAFVIWAAVAASAMFWALRLAATSPAAPAHTVAVVAAAAPRGDLTRLFGAAPVRTTAEAAAPVPSPLASRFRLLGVAAPRQGGDRHGLALIAVDGKPARSYAVGALIDGELVLQSVHPRGAKLGGRGAVAQVSLDLPALPAPATGSLSSALPSPVVAPAVAAPGAGVAGTIATLPQVVAPPPDRADQGEAAPVLVPPPPSPSPSMAPVTTR